MNELKVVCISFIFAFFAVSAQRLAAGNFSYSYDAAGRLVLVDYGAGLGVRYTYDPNGNLVYQAVVSTSNRFQATLDADSVITRISRGEGPVTVSYGQLTASGAQPGALSIFALTVDGVLVTEAGVPAVVPLSRARLFVDYGNGVNSGVALVNPNAFAIGIKLELRTASGDLVSEATVSLGARGHLAKFVDEFGFNLPATFVGTLTLSSSSTFAAVNLRTALNGRGEPLFSALPLVDLNAPPAGSAVVLPQVADGGGLPTDILLLNPSSVATISGTIAFFDDEGMPLALDFVGVGARSIVNYSLAPNGMIKLSTSGVGQVRSGYAVVTPLAGPVAVGSVIFSIRGDAGLASQAAVATSAETTAARLFTEVGSSSLIRNSGIALVNRNSLAASVTLNLAGLDGVARSATLTLPPNGHVAKFLTELFPGQIPPSFQGVLTLVSNVKVAPLTLRLTLNQRGDPILSTLPIVDLNNLSKGPQFLPQVVDGGGFRTQLILISTGGASNVVQIDFFDDAGNKAISPIQ